MKFFNIWMPRKVCLVAKSNAPTRSFDYFV